MAEIECPSQRDDYYVMASFIAPYKRADLVVRAFNAMPSRRLLVVGDGQHVGLLKAMAQPNVQFLGYLPRVDYLKTVSRAQALVFAGCEDFGIALAEAQAYGTPLIAFGRGGAADIVRPLGSVEKPTGVLFHEQSVEAVIDAVKLFEANRPAILPLACRENAMRFTPEQFARGVAAAFATVVAKHGGMQTHYSRLVGPVAAE
jgi:glycosyltransferase involved in cell wall biosynthesis